ncbi:MAG TPA: low temperature requirement protein A [Steroidobacteraceae bacterium]|nr:low temperature requirement protein A [Steroidobacteraceae bacterium]
MSGQQTELRVSSLELFFDLVFVFTITQLTALVEHHTSLKSIGSAAVIFVVMYWMYSAYVWLTNRVPPNSNFRKLLLVAGMSSFLTCALAIPKAFEQNSLAFAIGYAMVVIVHSTLYIQVHGTKVWRFVPFNLLGAACLVGAAFTKGWLQYAFWLAPIALHLVTSALASRVDESESSSFNIQAGHFVERHGLLLLITFGESIIAVGIGLSGMTLTLMVYSAAVLGLILVAALWWCYFSADEARAEHRMKAAPLTERVRLALHGYFYSYMLILFGIVILSAGLHHALSYISNTLPVEQALLLGAGVALFFLGTVAFKKTFGIQPLGTRIIASLAALLTCFAGTMISALAQIGLLIMVVVGCLIVEAKAESTADK